MVITLRVNEPQESLLCEAVVSQRGFQLMHNVTAWYFVKINLHSLCTVNFTGIRLLDSLYLKLIKINILSS